MRLRTVPAAAAAAVLAVALAACAAQTPEERVTALRAEYQVTLQGFQVVEQPLAAPAPVPVEEAGTASPGADAATGQRVAGEAEGPGAADSAPAPPEVPVRQDVILDLVVDNRSDGRLPGLTVDVEQGDAQAEAKTSYRIYLDTSGVAPGTRRAISHRLEDVEVAAGDGFRVEVRQAIPPEEREQYRELDEAGDEP